jgi:hypothetical protein
VSKNPKFYAEFSSAGILKKVHWKKFVAKNVFFYGDFGNTVFRNCLFYGAPVMKKKYSFR